MAHLSFESQTFFSFSLFYLRELRFQIRNWNALWFLEKTQIQEAMSRRKQGDGMQEDCSCWKLGERVPFIEPPDDLRCGRNDGKAWRCNRWRIHGRTYCELHHLQALNKSSRKKMKKKKKKKKAAKDEEKEKMTTTNKTKVEKRRRDDSEEEEEKKEVEGEEEVIPRKRKRAKLITEEEPEESEVKSVNRLKKIDLLKTKEKKRENVRAEAEREEGEVKSVSRQKKFDLLKNKKHKKKKRRDGDDDDEGAKAKEEEEEEETEKKKSGGEGLLDRKGRSRERIRKLVKLERELDDVVNEDVKIQMITRSGGTRGKHNALVSYS